MVLRPQSWEWNGPLIDPARTDSTVQRSLSTLLSWYPTSAECEQPHNVHHPVRLWSTRVYHVILGLVFKAHAATTHSGQRTEKKTTYASSDTTDDVFWIAVCAPCPGTCTKQHHPPIISTTQDPVFKLCVFSPSQHVAHVSPFHLTHIA